jgi:hypothetical protein
MGVLKNARNTPSGFSGPGHESTHLESPTNGVIVGRVIAFAVFPAHLCRQTHLTNRPLNLFETGWQ